MIKDVALPVLESMSDFALYETFYETGTMLGGTLVALEDKADSDHDSEAFQRWRQERLRLQHDRNATESRDRDGQIRMIRIWATRRNELEKLL